jgi:hypothetical protein
MSAIILAHPLPVAQHKTTMRTRKTAYIHGASHAASRVRQLHRKAASVIRVIDIETTCTDPASCEIIEIANVDMVRRGITNAMDTLARPARPIPTGASAARPHDEHLPYPSEYLTPTSGSAARCREPAAALGITPLIGAGTPVDAEGARGVDWRAVGLGDFRPSGSTAGGDTAFCRGGITADNRMALGQDFLRLQSVLPPHRRPSVTQPVPLQVLKCSLQMEQSGLLPDATQRCWHIA